MLKKELGLIVIIISLLFARGLLAQTYNQQMEDVVYKKNGEVLRGVIIEQVPNQYLKIKLKTGDIFIVDYKDIEKVVKEPSVSQQPKPQTAPPPPPPPSYSTVQEERARERMLIAGALSFFIGWGAGHYYLGKINHGILFTCLNLFSLLLVGVGVGLGGAASWSLDSTQATVGFYLAVAGAGLYIGSWLADWITALVSGHKQIEESKKYYRTSFILTGPDNFTFHVGL